MHPLPQRTALAAALAMALGLTAPAAVAVSLVAAKSPTVNEISAARATPDALILRAGIFDPAVTLLDTSAVGAAPATTTGSYAIVQFNAGVLATQRKALQAKGVQFLGYVPNRAYYVRLGTLSLAQLEQDASVRWAGLVQPGLKLDPQLWAGSRANSVAKQPDGSYQIIVTGFAGVSSAGLAEALTKQVSGVRITQRSQRANAAPYVHAAIGSDRFDALLKAATSIDGVEFVSPWVQAKIMNSGGIGAIQGNATDECPGSGTVCGPTPLWDHGLFGSGQIVAIGDSGTTPNAAFFTTLDKGLGPHTEVTLSDDPPPTLPNIGTLHPDNKIIGYWLQPGATNYDYASGHGTHTSGTLVGDAAGTFGALTYLASTPTAAHHELADGMAPNAQLLEQDMGGDEPDSVWIYDLQGTLEQAYAGGARIHSDSWGGEIFGVYSDWDVALDAATRASEGLLVVFCAGNNMAGPMMSNTPGTAKNSLSVAALGHAGSLIPAWFSNAGPTADGRMKPDIAAPGTDTISALHNLSVDTTPTAPLTWSASGTSMATPTVAGNAVLMRQFFVDGFYPRGEKTAADAYDPTGAVMKAVLLNGTNPLAALAWPNPRTGWGRAWLDGNLWFKQTLAGGDDSRRLRIFERTNLAGLETGEVNEYTIENVAAGAELRFTLTWFDVPSVYIAATALVNNLDLEVTDPLGITYLGNHFADGVSVPGGTADAIDSVEQIRLTAPTAGRYTVRVKAIYVPGDGSELSDRQGYALAVSGAFGLPDPVPFPAPTALQIAANDSSGVAIGFSAAAAAQSFQAYRAEGACATAKAGDFHLVAAGPASPLIDDRTVGGYSYAYEVRGVQNDVEGLVSDCVDVVSANTCSFPPTFDVNSIHASNIYNASCSIELDWSAALSRCPAASGIVYSVQRDSDPLFGSPQTLASGAATTYVDTDVVDGVSMFYRVVAADSDGNVAPLSNIAGASPAGSDGPDPATFVDDVDTHSYMTMDAPWQITTTAAANGSASYHSGADEQTYAAWSCTSLEMPPLKIPAGATLTYEAQYQLEYQWDGVVSEISTDDGATWNELAPSPLGFPSSFAQTEGNACNFPPSQGAFSGSSIASDPAYPYPAAELVFLPFSSRLSDYAGQTARIRWRFSSDTSNQYLGFWLDDVRIVGDGVFNDGFDPPPPPTGPNYVCH